MWSRIGISQQYNSKIMQIKEKEYQSITEREYTYTLRYVNQGAEVQRQQEGTILVSIYMLYSDLLSQVIVNFGDKEMSSDK